MGKEPSGEDPLAPLGLPLAHPTPSNISETSILALPMAELGERSPGRISTPSRPLPCAVPNLPNFNMAAVQFPVVGRMPASEKGVPFDFDSPFQELL